MQGKASEQRITVIKAAADKGISSCDQGILCIRVTVTPKISDMTETGFTDHQYMFREGEISVEPYTHISDCLCWFQRN